MHTHTMSYSFIVLYLIKNLDKSHIVGYRDKLSEKQFNVSITE